MSREQVTYVEHPLIRQGSVEDRLYQRSIADTATMHNTLVILPTALGKTLISVLAVADLLHRYRHGRALLMAPTKPLVQQHMETFLQTLKFGRRDVALLTGETPPRVRGPIWNSGCRLTFATPQIVRNDIKKGRVDLKDFVLLVFDECHRAVGNYAYSEIGKAYVEQCGYPLILGMTASPGSEIAKIMEICGNLYIEKVEYRTEEDPDVKPYIQSIEMKQRTVKLPSLYMAVRAQLRTLLDKRLSWLRRYGYLRMASRYVGRRILLNLGDDLRRRLEASPPYRRGPIYPAIINQSLCLTLYHMIGLLETQGLHSFKVFLDQVESEKETKRSYSLMVKQPEYQALKEMVDGNSVEHPKAELLTDIVDEQIGEHPNSRMLVFTQYRETASHLVGLLNRVVGVRAARFIGQGNRADDLGLTQDEQSERVEQLRRGELNVLVATSIGEEGLDIPSVDHVVFYEPIPSGIRYIQRRGRTGRRSSGQVTILATEDTLDMINLYSSSRRTEKMRRVIASVNNRLPEVVRSTSRPPPDPMTGGDLLSLEREDEVKSFAQVQDAYFIDLDKVKQTKSDARIDRIAQKLYINILERGSMGVTMAHLLENSREDGVSGSILESALEKLITDRVVTKTREGRYACTSALRSYGKTHLVRVDKVKRGFTEVMVDDEHSAKLFWEEYDGPRSLWRKGAVFNAIADLYMSSGEKHIWVKEVTEVLQHP